MAGSPEQRPGRVAAPSLPARRDAHGGVAVTQTGAETRSARLKGFTLGEVQKMGAIAAEAGMFGGRKKEDQVTPAQAVMKILAGLEIDIPITQALSMIDVIDGQPAYRAKLMAAVIKRSGKYRYRVVEWTDERCEIEWLELVGGVSTPAGSGISWEHPGPNTSFDIDDAKRAGLVDKTGSNYVRYPKAMLFARALSQGAGAYCMDVMAAGYTSEELYEEPRPPETYEEYADKVNQRDPADDPDIIDVEELEPEAIARFQDEVSEAAPARDRTPADDDEPATGSAPPGVPSPAQELYQLVGAGRVEEDDQVNAAQVRQLRKLCDPLDHDGLSRVVAYATRDDGARATSTPANLTTQRFGELRHFFENEQPGDRAKLLAAVAKWEANNPPSGRPADAASSSPAGRPPAGDTDPDGQGRLA